jgi:hypothetical protein
MRHHDALVVAASCGGSDRVPEWWLNLQSQPVALIERSGVKSVVHAYEAERDQLGHVTSAFEERFPQIHFYRAVSGRHIPLIVLEPHQRLRSDGSSSTVTTWLSASPCGASITTGRRSAQSGYGQ